MNKTFVSISLIAIIMCSAFIVGSKGVRIPHGDEYDHTLCVSCHDEWSPALFESYMADMRIHAPTLSAVIVNEVKGYMCNVSGLEVRGWVLCSDLFTPQDMNFEATRG